VDGVADTWDSKLKGNFNQIKKLKAKHPNLKVLVSLGGWTYSKFFSELITMAGTSSSLSISRRTFAATSRLGSAGAGAWPPSRSR
jgi:chitinase